MNNIKTIYVVFKTHFDIGFTELAGEIVHRYSHSMLADVVETCEKTREFGEKRSYTWTMAAWPLLQSVKNSDDPELTSRAKKLLESGQITWHGLPFTTLTEFCGLEDFIRGMFFSRQLSEEYGYRPISAKMTDVPGHTWMLPSLLHKAGIKFLHLGCNPASTSPDVPQLFFWEGPDKKRILTFYSKGAYGSTLLPPKEWTYPVWLAIQQTNDNIGPQGPAIIDQILQDVEKEMPGTEVVVGTMDEFYRALVQYPLDDLPVVRGDLADSWIHGAGTFPEEVGHLRRDRLALAELEKVFGLASMKKLVVGDRHDEYAKEFASGYENAILFGEHTLGLDAKTTLGHDRRYRREEFFQDLQLERYRRIEESWDEQREYVRRVTGSVETLRSKLLDTLAASVYCQEDRLVVFNALGWKRDTFVDLSAYRDDLEGKFLTSISLDGERGEYLEIVKIKGRSMVFLQDLPALGYRTLLVNDGESGTVNEELLTKSGETAGRIDLASGIVENAFFRIEVDRAAGGIRSLYDKKRGKEWVDHSAGATFGEYHYDIYGSEELNDYLRTYLYRFYDHAIHDFGRTNYPEQDHLTFISDNVTLVNASSQGLVSLSMVSRINDRSHREFGNAGEVVTNITLYDDQPYFDIEYKLIGKQKTHYIESGHFAFPLNLDHPKISINKLGCVVDPAKDIVKNANNGLYCLEHWIDFSDAGPGDGAGITVIAYDTPLFSIGEKEILKFKPEYEETAPLLLFSAFNNAWGTNSPQWLTGDYSFSYRFVPHDAETAEAATAQAALEHIHTPLVGFAGISNAKQGAIKNGDLPMSYDLIQDAPGLELVNFKPSEDGESIILRFRDYTGEPRRASVKFNEKFTKISRIDLLEREEQLLAEDSDELSFDSGAYEVHSFALLSSIESETSFFQEFR